MNKNILEDGFLDLNMNSFSIEMRKKYEKEYEVIKEYNSFIFELLNELTLKGYTQQNGYIMAALVEMHKFYQSAIILFERGLSEPANSLSRTMIDLLIKIVEVIRNPESVEELLLNTDYENKRTLEFLYEKELFSMVPKDEIEKMIIENREKIKDKKDPKIRTKKLAENNNLLEIYTLFRFQSDYTHQSTDIIGRIIKETSKGYYIDEDLIINNFKMEISLVLTIISITVEFILKEYLNNTEINERYKKIVDNFEDRFKDLLL